MFKIGKASLLLICLVTVFALCTATGAVAANLNGICDDNTSANDSECAVTTGGWVVEVMRGDNGEFPLYCDGNDTTKGCVDKRGNPIKGYRFAYLITSPNSGTSLSQANLLSSYCSDNTIKILFPADRSVKIREEDPSSKFGAFSKDVVITWDALKLDPSNQSVIAVYTTQAGADDKGMLLATATGYETFPAEKYILGPKCCEATQNITEIEVGSEMFPNGKTKVTFDSCTGNLKSVGEELKPVTTGIWLCSANEATPTVLSYCSAVKKIGPGRGGFLDVVKDGGNPGEYYFATRYYGYGSRFFKQEKVSGQIPTPCAEANTRLNENKMVFDNQYVAYYNECGDLVSATTLDGKPASKIKLYLFESDKDPRNGTLPPGGIVVNSGPRNGMIIDGSTYFSLSPNYYRF